MRNIRSKLGSIVCWGMLGIFLFSTGCTPTPTPAAVAPVAAVENTATPATATPKTAAVEPTATTAVDNTATPAEKAPDAAPEATKAEQATPLPATATPQPAAAAASTGLAAWCLPLESALSYAKDPLKPPSFAKQATFADAMLHVHGLPAAGCMFLVKFDKAAPTGLTLEIFEAKQTTPFFKADLKPVDGSPETLYAFVQHGSIVAPGRTKTVFALKVTDPLGQAQQKAELKLYSWVPGTPEPKEDDCGCEISDDDW